jgi:hypothetical protein
MLSFVGQQAGCRLGPVLGVDLHPFICIIQKPDAKWNTLHETL